MAKINDYPEVQSTDNLPESAMLVIEYGSNGGTKKISGKKFIEDLSGKVEYISYSGDISTHPDYASPKAIYYGNVSTRSSQGTSGCARTVIVGLDSGTTQARIATFIQGEMWYQTRTKNGNAWGDWGNWSPVRVAIPNSSISEAQLVTALRNKINDVYTKAEVDSKISSIAGLSFKIVSSLPTTDISSSTIYLIRESGNTYSKWVYIDNEWVPLGSSEIDMSSKVDKTTEIAGVPIESGISASFLRVGLNMPRIFRIESNTSISDDADPPGDTRISQTVLQERFGVNGRPDDILVMVYNNYKTINICTEADNSDALFTRADACYKKVDKSIQIAGIPIENGISKASLQQALRVNEAVYLYSQSLAGSPRDDDKILLISAIANQHPDHTVTTGDLLYGIYYRYLYVCIRTDDSCAYFTPINKVISDDTIVRKDTHIAGIEINDGITKVAFSNNLQIPRLWHTFEPLIDGNDYGRGGNSEMFVPLSNLKIGNTDVHTDDELVDYRLHEADFVYSMNGEGLYMAEVMGADTIEIDGESVSGWWLEPIRLARESVTLDRLAPGLQAYFAESTTVFFDEIHSYTDPTTGKRKYGTNRPLATYNKHGRQPIILMEPNYVENGVRNDRFFISTSVDYDVVNQKINRIEASVTTLNGDGMSSPETIVFERTENTSDNDPVFFDVVDSLSSDSVIVVQLTPDYEDSELVGYTSNLSFNDALKYIKLGYHILLSIINNAEGTTYSSGSGEYFRVTDSSYNTQFNSVHFDAVNLRDIYEDTLFYTTLEGVKDSSGEYMYFAIVERKTFEMASKAEVDIKADQENGNVSVSSPEYYSGSNHTMEGTYQRVGEYCTVTATAKVVAGWQYTYYRLPFVPLSNVMAFIMVGSVEYAIKTDTANGYNCVNIYRTDGNFQAQGDDLVPFTITYRCSDDYSMHQGYTQAEVDQIIANHDAEIESLLSTI